ncbi:MAG: hypothetical protein JRG91_11340 [Deltaproteobacteria bacterium]|nr:hypothetical protein [Deltaproteobacteria bacterium]
MGLELTPSLYKLLTVEGYDPDTEKWEFRPGSIVNRASPRMGNPDVDKAKLGNVPPEDAWKDRMAALVLKSFVASLIFFASGAFLGFFLTAFIPVGPSSWPYVVYGRIIWQLGGAVWFGVSCGCLFASSLKGRMLCVVLGSLVGGLLCFNPLRDVIENQGPVHLEGARLVDFDVKPVSLKSSARGIIAELRFRDDHGREVSLRTRGLHANRWQRAFQDCEKRGWRSEQPVDVTAFEHLGTLVELRCDFEPIDPGSTHHD